MKTSARVPLQRDEKLWEAFKEDREACQRRAASKVGKRRTSRPTNCVQCDRKMRPSKALLVDYPNTVRHHSRGICGTCAHRNRKANQ